MMRHSLQWESDCTFALLSISSTIPMIWTSISSSRASEKGQVSRIVAKQSRETATSCRECCIHTARTDDADDCETSHYYNQNELPRVIPAVYSTNAKAADSWRHGSKVSRDGRSIVVDMERTMELLNDSLCPFAACFLCYTMRHS